MKGDVENGKGDTGESGTDRCTSLFQALSPPIFSCNFNQEQAWGQSSNIPRCRNTDRLEYPPQTQASRSQPLSARFYADGRGSDWHHSLLLRHQPSCNPTKHTRQQKSDTSLHLDPRKYVRCYPLLGFLTRGNKMQRISFTLVRVAVESH